MRRSSLAWVLLFLAPVGCSNPEVAFDLGAAIDREVTRLDAMIAQMDQRPLSESLTARLKSYRETLGSMREIDSVDLRLYELREPFVGVETIDFLTRHEDARDSIGDLEHLWAGRKPAFEFHIATRDGSLRSALIEGSETAAERLFEASLAYGRISSPSGGLYYLAEAEANRRFMVFLADLPTRTEDPVAGRQALIAAADQIESEAREAFNDDLTSRAMIPVSMRLDDAREMIERGRLAGATLDLLEARLHLSRKVGASGRDESARNEGSSQGSFPSTIGTLLNGMASGTENEDVARIARTELIPLYDLLLHESSAAVADDGEPAATLTLVRWPYT